MDGPPKSTTGTTVWPREVFLSGGRFTGRVKSSPATERRHRRCGCALGASAWRFHPRNLGSYHGQSPTAASGTDPVGKQTQRLFLDPVLHLAARAIPFVVNFLRGPGQVGDEETRRK